MFDAQVLFRGCIVFSPWYPRGGDNCRQTMEIVHVSGATLKVELFTKNKEDAGDGANADAAGTPVDITSNTAGRTTQEWLSRSTIGLKELVRYKFTVTGTNAFDWVLFRMLTPQWFNSVATAT